MGRVVIWSIKDPVKLLALRGSLEERALYYKRLRKRQRAWFDGPRSRLASTQLGDYIDGRRLWAWERRDRIKIAEIDVRLNDLDHRENDDEGSIEDSEK